MLFNTYSNITKPLSGVMINPLHPLVRGLVGCWLFNERSGRTAFDSSNFSNHGTLNGFAQPRTADSGWNPSKFGGGLKFDGTSNYVDCGNDPSLDCNNAITIEAWIKADTTVDAIAILEKGKTGSTTFQGYTLTISANILYFFIADGTARDYISPAFTSTDWSHIVGTFDGDWLRLYVNGVEVESKDTALTSIATSALPLKLGIRSYTAAQYFNGTIDCIRIWNRALTALEVRQLYTAPFNNYKRG